MLQSIGASRKQLSEQMFQKATAVPANKMDPQCTSLASALLRLCFEDPVAEQLLVAKLLDKRHVTLAAVSTQKRKAADADPLPVLSLGSPATSSQQFAAQFALVSTLQRLFIGIFLNLFAQDIHFYFATHFEVYTKHLQAHPTDPVLLDQMEGILSFFIGHRRYINER